MFESIGYRILVIVGLVTLVTSIVTLANKTPPTTTPSQATSCNGTTSPWCAPGTTSTENCCAIEQCTGSSCPQSFPDCGTLGSNPTIGQCNYKCLNGVLRLLSCANSLYTDPNREQATCGTTAALQSTTIGHCAYQCGSGALFPLSCDASIATNLTCNGTANGGVIRFRQDGSTSFLPSDSCLYVCFAGDATKFLGPGNSNPSWCFTSGGATPSPSPTATPNPTAPGGCAYNGLTYGNHSQRNDTSVGCVYLCTDTVWSVQACQRCSGPACVVTQSEAGIQCTNDLQCPSPTPTGSPSPTPTSTASPSPTPTRSPSPTPTRSPSPTPTRSPSPTPTLPPCNSFSNTVCVSNLVCAGVNGTVLTNASCTTGLCCQFTPSPTPTNSPSPSPTGLPCGSHPNGDIWFSGCTRTCNNGVVIPGSCPTASPSPTPTRSPSPTPTRSPSPTPLQCSSVSGAVCVATSLCTGNDGTVVTGACTTGACCKFPAATASPSPTPTRSPSPTPTLPPCTNFSNTVCVSQLVCSGVNGTRLNNASCTTGICCQFSPSPTPTATASPSPTPASCGPNHPHGDVWFSVCNRTCIDGVVSPLFCPSPSPSPTLIPTNQPCTSSNQCATGYCGRDPLDNTLVCLNPIGGNQPTATPTPSPTPSLNISCLALCTATTYSTKDGLAKCIDTCAPSPIPAACDGSGYRCVTNQYSNITYSEYCIGTGITAIRTICSQIPNGCNSSTGRCIEPTPTPSPTPPPDCESTSINGQCIRGGCNPGTTQITNAVCPGREDFCCTKKKELDEECRTNEECKTGVCARDPLDNTRVCRPAPTSTPAGLCTATAIATCVNDVPNNAQYSDYCVAPGTYPQRTVCEFGCSLNGRCKVALTCDANACPGGCNVDNTCKTYCSTTKCPNGCSIDSSSGGVCKKQKIFFDELNRLYVEFCLPTVFSCRVYSLNGLMTALDESMSFVPEDILIGIITKYPSQILNNPFADFTSQILDKAGHPINANSREEVLAIALQGQISEESLENLLSANAGNAGVLEGALIADSQLSDEDRNTIRGYIYNSDEFNNKGLYAIGQSFEDNLQGILYAAGLSQTPPERNFLENGALMFAGGLDFISGGNYAGLVQGSGEINLSFQVYAESVADIYRGLLASVGFNTQPQRSLAENLAGMFGSVIQTASLINVGTNLQGVIDVSQNYQVTCQQYGWSRECLEAAAPAGLIGTFISDFFVSPISSLFFPDKPTSALAQSTKIQEALYGPANSINNILRRNGIDSKAKLAGLSGKFKEDLLKLIPDPERGLGMEIIEGKWVSFSIIDRTLQSGLALTSEDIVQLILSRTKISRAQFDQIVDKQLLADLAAPENGAAGAYYFLRENWLLKQGEAYGVELGGSGLEQLIDSSYTRIKAAGKMSGTTRAEFGNEVSRLLEEGYNPTTLYVQDGQILSLGNNYQNMVSPVGDLPIHSSLRNAQTHAEMKTIVDNAGGIRSLDDKAFALISTATGCSDRLAFCIRMANDWGPIDTLPGDILEFNAQQIYDSYPGTEQIFRGQTRTDLMAQVFDATVTPLSELLRTLGSSAPPVVKIFNFNNINQQFGETLGQGAFSLAYRSNNLVTKITKLVGSDEAAIINEILDYVNLEDLTAIKIRGVVVDTQNRVVGYQIDYLGMRLNEFTTQFPGVQIPQGVIDEAAGDLQTFQLITQRGHGDMHAGNILVETSTQGVPTKINLIDYAKDGLSLRRIDYMSNEIQDLKLIVDGVNQAINTGQPYVINWSTDISSWGDIDPFDRLP